MKVTSTGHVLHILQVLYEKCIYWTGWHINNILDLNFLCARFKFELGHWLSWLTVFVVCLISSRQILGHYMHYAMAAACQIIPSSLVYHLLLVFSTESVVENQQNKVCN